MSDIAIGTRVRWIRLNYLGTVKNILQENMTIIYQVTLDDDRRDYWFTANEIEIAP